MKTTFCFNNHELIADLSQPIDISIPLNPGNVNPNCFYAPEVKVWPVKTEDFVGSTAEGGVLNFMNLQINPHGNGTHTECVGHIAKEKVTINDTLKQFFFLAQLITVTPAVLENSDRIITKEQLMKANLKKNIPALILRTLPNDDSKKERNYSGTNPPYMHHEAIQLIVENGVRHLLIDLPSVDREQDDGLLLSHHAFWDYPENPRQDCTISELIYVPNQIQDGLYLLSFQIISLELDVSPSKPVLYKTQKAGDL
jgi:kynurenine formamidase